MKRRTCVFLLAVSLLASRATAQDGGELSFTLGAEPKTFNPLLVADEPSETIRYLTAGVLIRVNRKTQRPEPELATSWRVLEGGRKIQFSLRKGVRFSDGEPFSAEDVAFTFEKLLDPELRSPVGDSFRSGAGPLKVEIIGTHSLTIVFPAPVAGLERLFDQAAILSSRAGKPETAVLGPFQMTEHKAGSYVLLRRNPHYWKSDKSGKRLPRLDSVRLVIQRNRQMEMLRFRRGQFHLINSLAPELFDRLAGRPVASVHDAGPSMGSEMLWFNQAKKAPLPAYKKAWFQSRTFRRAISASIHRRDLCRVVYRGHAVPATGPVSPANKFWFNAGLSPHAFDPAGALRGLEKEGFRRNGETLHGPTGKPVEFSVITNAGNKSRERMATMIQQDLAKQGIRLNLVTLDFASLIERITRTLDYEACLLGLVSVDLDPNDQMNVWLSSARNHQWNPNQEKPETPWEAEIDELMRSQASALERSERKAAFDRVQQIVWEQAPFIYLIHRNALSAVSSKLRNADPGVLWPQTFWNAEHLYFETATTQARE